MSVGKCSKTAVKCWNEEVGAKEALLRSAKKNLGKAQRRYDKAKRKGDCYLFNKDYGLDLMCLSNQEKLRQATEALRVARARVKSAEKDLSAAQSGAESAKKEVDRTQRGKEHFARFRRMDSWVDARLNRCISGMWKQYKQDHREECTGDNPCKGSGGAVRDESQIPKALTQQFEESCKAKLHNEFKSRPGEQEPSLEDPDATTQEKSAPKQVAEK